MQDESAGTWVGVSRARRDKIWTGDDSVIAAIRLGMRVEVEGVTDPGGYAPVILPRAVRVLNEKELPDALRVSLPRFFSGAADGLRVGLGTAAAWFDRWVWAGLVDLFHTLGQFTGWISGRVDEDALNGGFDAGCEATRWSGRRLSLVHNGQAPRYLRIVALGATVFALLLFGWMEQK